MVIFSMRKPSVPIHEENEAGDTHMEGCVVRTTHSNGTYRISTPINGMLNYVYPIQPMFVMGSFLISKNA